MTRKVGFPRAGTTFEPGDPPKIGGKRVGRVVFRAAWFKVWGCMPPGCRAAHSCPIPRGRGPRARKVALLARRPLRGCLHEFSYHQDTIGDYGVVNGTYIERWLECDCCGVQRPATYKDMPGDDWEF
jgi:hypothetical protein